ncbi:MAG: gamma-glutamylcyclotransferase [Paracoccus sp. (in: a-proteobacteria)]|nr:gamma-glutamylcyclotransferase [Paracoccus sp. (in: a-proteobacteria)]
MGGWVFAYGSLMWNPEMPVAEAVVARLDGYARSFCLRSVRHRGTPEAPGLVLGLDAAEGAVCTGLALRVAPADWAQALADLRAREMVTAAYREEVLAVTLADGRRVEAVAYVMRAGHPQHAAGLSLEDQAAIIANAQGGRGPNADYLFNTVTHLARMGLPDPDLEGLAQRVQGLLTVPGS